MFNLGPCMLKNASYLDLKPPVAEKFLPMHKSLARFQSRD